MFSPKYIITNRLLGNIKRINTLVVGLNYQRFSKVVLVELERMAREVSSYASTSIEGNPLPLTEVKKVLKSAPQNAIESEREVLNYNEALKSLNKETTKKDQALSLGLVLKIHSQVMKNLLPNFEVGKTRQKPVVVNDPRTDSVVYLPPDHKDVEPLMSELIDFVNRNKKEIDPLILAGVFHKQMVLIHPFVDGNGRTTRLATKVLLAQMGLNTFNLFSFENYYNKNVTKYFQYVGERGNYYELKEKIDYTDWLLYFTEGIIDELLRIKKVLASQNVNPENKLKDYQRKIVDFIEKNGFIKDSDYAKITTRKKATRALDFKKLIVLGLITKRAKGRATYYVLKAQTVSI